MQDEISTTAKLALDEINRRIDRVIEDVDNKENKETIKYELEAIKKDIASVQAEQARVNSYGRWVIIFIAGALLTAILNLVLVKQ